MTAKQISFVDVPKAEYRNFRDKGLQFFSVMKSCLQDGDWDAVLLNGVHAAISLSDAMTVFVLGRRSSGKSHLDASGLLSQAVSQESEGRRNADRLAQILNWKHDAEYEPKRASEREAYDFAKIVERFVEWVRTKLPT
jgi:HEPN domain-containing protein